MEQELISKKVAVIGCGAAGGFFSVLAVKNPYVSICAFDFLEPFSSLLPTGGGRCNLSFAQSDITSFVKNYPRGEKFLLSVFSKMPPNKTISLFEDLGVKTYIQNDKRIFPVTNSSRETIKILRKHLNTSNFEHKKERVISILKKDNYFKINTENNSYNFDYVVIATGNKGMNLIKQLKHNVIEPRPALTSLDIKEKYFYSLSGLTFKNVEINVKFNKHKYFALGDLLFTHKSISGPVVFKISSLSAYEDFSIDNPMILSLKLINLSFEEIDDYIKNNSKKSVKNIFSKFVPLNFVNLILSVNKIDGLKQAAQLKKQEKEILIQSLISLKLTVENRIKDSEIVMAGGVDLKEINPKTMESKLIPNLFFIGEVTNIDGFTGGFNLQNCWSCAYICSLNF